MKNTFLLFFFCWGLMACSQPQGESAKIKEAEKVEEVEIDSPLFDLKNVHRFSDSIQMDTLRLQVSGDDLLRGKAQFTITRFDGKVIYQQFFPVQKLLGNQVISMDKKQRTLSDTERKGILTTRLNGFFGAKNYIVPAVSFDDFNDKIVERNIVDKEFWERLKLESASVGFVYTFGDNNRTWIAYDRPTGEVRVYYKAAF